MINQGTWVGRLTAQPELKYTPNGKAIATFFLACERSFTNQAGEREADFIPVVVWGKTAENCANTLKPGDVAGGSGRIQTRRYTDDSGKNHYPWEVVLDNVKFFYVKAWAQNAQNGQNSAGNSQPSTNTQTGNQRPQNGHQGPQTVNGRQPGTNPPFFNDPFANVGQPVDIKDDELPF